MSTAEIAERMNLAPQTIRDWLTPPDEAAA
jgi:uncharacterized protein YjcR